MPRLSVSWTRSASLESLDDVGTLARLIRSE